MRAIPQGQDILGAMRTLLLQKVLVFIAFAVTATCHAAEPLFSASIDKAAYSLHEDIWLTIVATNPTNTPLRVRMPVVATGFVEIEIVDHSGRIVGEESGCELVISTDADTIPSEGSVSEVVRLNYLMRERDTISGRHMVPVGSYRARLAWRWAKLRTGPSDSTILRDSVDFKVLAPRDEEASAMIAYVTALSLPNCRERSAALWNCFQAFPSSPYGDECLQLLTIQLGELECTPPALDRAYVGEVLVTKYPSHPRTKPILTMVYQNVAQKSADAGRAAMVRILESVPPESDAGNLARAYLEANEQ